MRPDKTLIEPRFKESIDRWVRDACPLGGFLRAVLENNLSEAIARGDSEAIDNLGHVVAYLYNDCPGDCSGLARQGPGVDEGDRVPLRARLPVRLQRRSPRAARVPHSGDRVSDYAEMVEQLAQLIGEGPSPREGEAAWWRTLEKELAPIVRKGTPEQQQAVAAVFSAHRAWSERQVKAPACRLVPAPENTE